MIKNKIFTIPNILTFMRLPCAILVILSPSLVTRYIFLALGIFLDFLDGYVAKKYNQTTKLGAIMDPMFDRIFVLILFIFFYGRLNLPVYFILMFFARDIVTALFAFAFLVFKLSSKIEIKARAIGKIATIIQFVVLLFMVAENLELTTIGIYITFAVSIAALVDYSFYIRKRLRHS